jgi:uncharacterized protein YlzI (FlbEa/FlbD family)
VLGCFATKSATLTQLNQIYDLDLFQIKQIEALPEVVVLCVVLWFHHQQYEVEETLDEVILL